mmetsp:Transcript_53663/g.106790  ORF Transcript_53663/g.106790 Transcript_53663/m.106790 type:complete len:87 (+) Transcript_53663:187-447(+)
MSSLHLGHRGQRWRGWTWAKSYLKSPTLPQVVHTPPHEHGSSICVAGLFMHMTQRRGREVSVSGELSTSCLLISPIANVVEASCLA